MPEILTTNEVAELARVSPATVRFWRWKGTGPKSFKLGRRALYDRAEVLAWIEQAKTGRVETAQAGA